MQLILNGEPKEFAQPLTIRELLRTMDIAPERCAVVVNGAVIRREAQETHPLESGDTVDLITMVGGG